MQKLSAYYKDKQNLTTCTGLEKIHHGVARIGDQKVGVLGKKPHHLPNVAINQSSCFPVSYFIFSWSYSRSNESEVRPLAKQSCVAVTLLKSRSGLPSTPRSLSKQRNATIRGRASSTSVTLEGLHSLWIAQREREGEREKGYSDDEIGKEYKLKLQN